MNPTSDDFRLLPETDMYMSTKTINCLRRSDYCTTERLMMATTEDLMKLRGFGIRSLQEVAAWREALMQPDTLLYAEMYGEVVKALREVGSIVAESQAPYVMRAVWRVIARGPFTAARVRQLLMPGEVEV